MKFSKVPLSVLLFVVAALYFGAAEFGLSLAFVHANVSPVWPPTGVAIAAVLWLGYRVSPAILLGAFLANLATGVSVATAGGIAVGNTLEAVTAVYLLHRFVGLRHPFDRGQDVVKFVLLAGALSPTVSATIGNLSLCLGGAEAWANFGPLWLTWWLGDGAGALVVAPLLLTWIEKPSEPWSPRRSAEAVLLLASLSIDTSILFGGWSLSRVATQILWRLIFPFLLWAAFRLGPRGVATAMALFSGIAIWGTRRGFGPFVAATPNESLLLLQVFVAALAITFLVVAVIVAEHKRAQQTISSLASVVESTSDAVIGKTLDGTIISWNKGAERIYGYTAEEVVGRSISILFPPDQTDDLRQIVDRLKRGERIDNYEARRVRKDGQIIYTSVSISPTKDAAGKVNSASAIARDITERQRAEEALRAKEAQLRLITDITPVMLTQCSRELRYQFVNRAYAERFGLTPEQIMGKPVREIMGEEAYEAIRPYVEIVLEGRPVEYEAEIPYSRIGQRFMRVAYMPDRDEQGQVVGWMASLSDITERKRAEAEREQLLAREQAARAEAEAASRLKDEFLATVSHELRTPLNAMLGWTSLLRTGRLEGPRAQRALETIDRNVRLQAQLIEDLLDVSRIITGKLRLNLSPVDLVSLVEETLESMRPTAEAKGVFLESLLEPLAGPLSGDAQRLQQIVWNLLSNALKFTPSGGRVVVQLSRTHAEAELTVRDTGQGIAPDFLPYVFERFRQASGGSTRKYGGLGLGLAIVRYLVEAHGGEISAQSEGEGKGAVFTVRLPLLVNQGRERRPAIAPSPLSLEASPSLSGVRILVVDDEIDAREIVSAVLSECGALVTVVPSSARGLQALAEDRFDVVLSDIEMPEEDGYSFIQKVRERGHVVPAAALTAYASAEDRSQALRSGYQLHLAKPVEPAQLITVVASLAGLLGQRTLLDQWPMTNIK